jgi:hypothetical protein
LYTKLVEKSGPLGVNNFSLLGVLVIGYLMLVGMQRKSGLDYNIGHGLFVGWVEHPVVFCWVSFLYPTYLLSIIVPSTKPNKMSEERTITNYQLAGDFLASFLK